MGEFWRGEGRWRRVFLNRIKPATTLALRDCGIRATGWQTAGN
ncbi:MAG TPA: hypothetical protein PLW24_01340 [Burkholderiaceae bacterium]|nr:hypothetical protein [Burkholderiaceae bacterium]HNB45406.1 hypothetical protein [Burkholderiaceae bacterium]HNG78084.1 hypothetical protein [Burkholderiaceae bacterium]